MKESLMQSIEQRYDLLPNKLRLIRVLVIILLVVSVLMGVTGLYVVTITEGSSLIGLGNSVLSGIYMGVAVVLTEQNKEVMNKIRIINIKILLRYKGQFQKGHILYLANLFNKKADSIEPLKNKYVTLIGAGLIFTPLYAAFLDRVFPEMSSLKEIGIVSFSSAILYGLLLLCLYMVEDFVKFITTLRVNKFRKIADMLSAEAISLSKINDASIRGRMKKG